MFVSGQGQNDVTLNSDDETGNPEVCADYALSDARCHGGYLMYSPAYSWEWGFKCCLPGATLVSNNVNWNIISYAPLESPSPPSTSTRRSPDPMPPPPPQPSPPEPSPPPPPPPRPPEPSQVGITIGAASSNLETGATASGACGALCMVLMMLAGACAMLACTVLVVCLRRRYVRSKLPHSLQPAWQPSNQLRRVGDSTQMVLGSAHMSSMQPLPMPQPLPALVSATPVVVEDVAFAKVAPWPYRPPPVSDNFGGADDEFDTHKI